MATAIRSAMLGGGVGAGLMFLLDPVRGARRRALVRDKFVRATRTSRDAYSATRRDLGNRLRGAAAQLQTRLRHEPADDPTLEARVRAALGRVCSHAHAVRVAAVHGAITLSGDVLADERRAIESAVRGVRGVGEVTDRLTVHATREAIPALQGRGSRPGSWSWIAGSWSPTAKMIAAAGAAATVIAAAAARRG